MLADVLSTVLGGMLIAASLFDVLQTLFRPLAGSGGGYGSAIIGRVAWRMMRVTPRSRLPLGFAGPAIMVVVILVWILALIFGWALVYWRALPAGFAHAGNTSVDFIDAIYVSMVTLSTLGFGDIVPVTAPLRLLTATQALIGFSMITACITWNLSVYPVLARRRALAYEIFLLHTTARRWDLHFAQLDEHVEGVLRDLMRALAAVHADLQQFPHTYYFHSDDRRFELSAMLPRLMEVAVAAAGSESGALKFQSDLLRQALHDLARTLTTHVGGDPDNVAEVMGRYARDHESEACG